MSKSLENDAQETSANRTLCYSLVKNKHKRVLKSRENIFKPKCSRELKKKLKKYKLRRDGIEDPDVLDVSKILVTSLRIKSPNNRDKINCNNNIIEQEELNQGNYLIKMVRKKKICTEVIPLVDIINDTVQNKESDMKILAEEVGDKKHTNAFKLMMKARNKNIGTNSPGKVKIEEQDFKAIVERKEIKAKRNLALQKMAQSKGSLKNKEIEELRDKCIEKRLVKRSETFKQMITKNDSIKNEQKANNTCAKQSQPSNEKSNLIKTKPEKNKSLKLCNIFNETIEIIDHSKNPKLIPTEDVEFLKKLSPSIRKKENMLSYFQKIPKDDPELLENNCTEENNDSIIKVKFNTKCKKKKNTLKLTEKLHTTSETIKNKILIIGDSDESNNGHKIIKRKRNLNVEAKTSPPLQINNLNSSNSESRPKRNVKKPIKYTEDVQRISSDEELYIFTPKKKKNSEKPLKTTVEKTEQMLNTMDNITKKNNVGAKDSVLELSQKDESKNKSKLIKTKTSNPTKGANNLSSKSLKHTNGKKAVKLAPIFVAKMQLSPADIEAKQNFLKSGVPENLKKKVKNPTNETVFDIFPSVVHIQQSEPHTNSHQEKDWFNSSNYDLIDESYFTQNEYLFKNLLTLEEACNLSVHFSKLKPEKVLKSIKCAYPKFPVYRTYHLLSGKSKGEFKDSTYTDLDNSIEIINGQYVDISNENPDQLNWCDKYKPTSSKQIIGNFESIKELKRWLETWTENVKAKQIASDSSDYSDFYHSDTDSRDTNKPTNNILILTGQTGSGKTTSVYAVASELAIKVIEVNASSKRTGKIMLQDLQEATQSHKVDRGKNSSDNSQKLQEEIMSIKIKKRGRTKKAHNEKHNADGKTKQSSLKTSEISQSQILASQESVRTGMSLVLIDDADIIFDQDDGFCSAIAQLIQSSKRPVILVTSSLTCPHLQRFLQYGKVLYMHPILSRMLGTWLDVMCLADVGKCCTGLGAKMLDFYRGDIRKTINCLQFYMSSNKYINHGDEVALSQIKHNIDDEDSSMSWVDSENFEPSISNDTEVNYYIDNHLQVLQVGCPLNVFNIWWNLPRLYKHCNKTKIHESDENSTNIHCTEPNATERLNTLAHVLDIISEIDYFDHKSPDTCTNISTRPWYSSENASLLENENFECYNKSSLVTEEISDVLIKSTITEAQRVFKCENSLNFPTPSMSDQRKRDKTVSRHNTLSEYLNTSVVLDRRATALDYWPTCRTICRIEKNRTDSNVKRKSRFCHYLKSLNIPGRNDFFDSLADSLT